MRLDDYDDDELDAAEAEQLEEDVVDAATAARTAEELATEISCCTDLVALATRVRDLGQDRKWDELRSLILDQGRCATSTATRASSSSSPSTATRWITSAAQVA